VNKYEYDPTKDGCPRTKDADKRGIAASKKFDPERHYDHRKPKKYEWLNGSTA